jgi:hypothetical protein
MIANGRKSKSPRGYECPDPIHLAILRDLGASILSLDLTSAQSADFKALFDDRLGFTSAGRLLKDWGCSLSR